jgi:hypothetical protein
MLHRFYTGPHGKIWYKVRQIFSKALSTKVIDVASSHKTAASGTMGMTSYF